MTWFRRETGVHWLVGFGNEPKIQQEALEYVHRRLYRNVPGAAE
jgi:hypothetical protein